MSSQSAFRANILQKLAIVVFLPFMSLWIIIKAIFNKLTVLVWKISEGDKDYFDIICISHVSWDHVWQRNHQTMTRLARKHKILYCLPEVAHVLIKHPNMIFPRKLKPVENLFYYKILRLSGETRFNIINKLNKFIIVSEIKRLLKKHSFNKSVLWFYFPPQEYLVGALDEILTVYDIQDDYSAFAWRPKNLIQAEKKLLKKVDIVFTGTNALYEKNKPFHNNIHFFPCGVEFNHFAKQDLKIIPEDIKNIKHPILGYFGLIDNRIDAELLEYMANTHKDWSILMIGPIDSHVFKKPDCENIYFVGKKEYKDLPYYLQEFDICLMPFAINELTNKINPTKTLEYFASGKPVVSTAIPDMIKYYSGVLGISYSKEEFAQLCEQALNYSEKFNIRKGIEMAKSRSWEAMVEQIERIIEEEIIKES